MSPTLTLKIKPFTIEVTPEREAEYANLEEARERAVAMITTKGQLFLQRLADLEALMRQE